MWHHLVMIRYFRLLRKVIIYGPERFDEKPKRLSSVYYESEDFKEVKALDAADRARLDILTQTSYALHDENEAGDLTLSIKICKEALEELDTIGGQPGTDKIARSIQELANYKNSLMSQPKSDPLSE